MIQRQVIFKRIQPYMIKLFFEAFFEIIKNASIYVHHPYSFMRSIRHAARCAAHFRIIGDNDINIFI